MIFFSPDNIHINNKNFTSLIKVINSNNNKFIQNTNYINLVTCYGNYNGIDEILEYKKEYEQYSKEMLFSASNLGYNLFDLCRAELLTYTITKEKFFDFKYYWTRNELFNFLYDVFYTDLINNISAASFWLSYWKNYIIANKFEIALVFSGSLIYTKTLLKILEKTSIRAFVLESFFTGNDFYCEESFSHISNNSLIKYKSYYDSIEINDLEFHKDYIKSINKYLMSNNLNVKQPLAKNKLLFDKNQTVAIIGQVVNDFSVIEYNEIGINSILLYEKLISDIIAKTNYNIIFKAHPWEHKKINLNCSFTLNYLYEKFSQIIGDRLIFLDEYNIDDVFDQSDEVIVINSQAGINAIWAGIKPIVLGDPFYGNKGFTVDISINKIEDVCNYLLKRTSRSVLTMEEYKKFKIFLIKTFQYHLISKFPSGESLLKKIFQTEKTISLYHKPENSENKILKNKIKDIQLTKNDIINKENSCNNEKKVDYIKNKFFSKLKKLKNRPYDFFIDSQKKYIKYFAKFFVKKV